MRSRMLWCLGVVLAVWCSPGLARADVAPEFTDSPINLVVAGIVAAVVIGVPVVLYVRWQRARSARLRDPDAP